MTQDETQQVVQALDYYIPEYTKYIEQSAYASHQHQQYLTFLKTHDPDKDLSEFAELIALNDFNGYTLYSLLDLCTCMKGFLQASNSWEQIFFIKHGYLVVFECLDTYALHNTAMNVLLKGKYAAMKPAYDKVAGEIKEYQKQHGDRQVRAKRRNTIIAHIDKNFLNYYEGIRALDGVKGFESLISFIDILQHLQQFLSDFVSETNTAWKQETNARDARLENMMNDIELKFEQIGEDSSEIKKMKEELIKRWHSLKEIFIPKT